jgi:uncharacterized protein YjbJ (UPF0337 family)
MGRKKWLIGGLIAGGLATVVVLMRRRDSGYEWDDIDAAGEGDTFGDRPADAPEQVWAPAETRTNVTPESLSMAARVETSWQDIQTVWPSLTLDDARPAEGDLDRLAARISEKVEQPKDEVRARLDEIIARDTPTPSFPAH